MYKVKTLNKIAKVGLERLPAEHFSVDDNCASPDAVLVRSASMHEAELPENLLSIGRAGAGVNNIPLDRCSAQGIVVFNAPGANANAVKELALCSLLLASRDIVGGVIWARGLSGDDVPAQVEKGKSAFIGPEISGKTLGIVGLGAIGAGVANAALHLGMDVIGFDPFLSVDAALKVCPEVRRTKDIGELFACSDYISVHVPLTNDTKAMLSGLFSKCKKGVRVINLSRGGLFDDAALIEALNSGMIARYVTDFPNAELIACPGVVPIPHLGASTPESEDNCAVMVADQTREYILTGAIRNSVNMPAIELARGSDFRLSVLYENTDTFPGELAAFLNEKNINAVNMETAARGGYGCILADVEARLADETIAAIGAMKGVLRARLIEM